MSERSRPMSLREIEGTEIEGTSFNLKLPEFIDDTRIVFHPGRINRLKRIGGIGQLEIVGREGSTSQYRPSMVGQSSSGEGYAGATGRQELVPTSSSSRLGQEYHTMPLPGRWANAQVVVNLSEVSDRISERRPKDGIRSTREWSKELDSAIRKGVREAGRKQLLAKEGGSYFNLISSTLVGTGVGEYVLGASGIPIGLGFTYLLNHALERVEQAKAVRNGEPNEGFRFSFLPGLQLDRLATLQGMSRTTRVVGEKK